MSQQRGPSGSRQDLLPCETKVLLELYGAGCVRPCQALCRMRNGQDARARCRHLRALESIKTCAPLELVCIDFWTAEDSKNCPIDVLVITDHFTKLALAFYCPDQTAKQMAQRLWDNFFCYYGFPERIHSDQDANFESELIAALLQVSSVKKSHTAAYHLMGNMSAERFNRTLGNTIRTLSP